MEEMPRKSNAVECLKHNIRQVLEEKSWTLQQLADATDDHRPGLSRWLNSEDGITVERAERIATALGYSLAELLAGKFSRVS